MKTFLLLLVISTNKEYDRGWGDGIASSKSASAAIHTERFFLKEDCEAVKNKFLTNQGLTEDVRNKSGMKTGTRTIPGITAECIKLKVK